MSILLVLQLSDSLVADSVPRYKNLAANFLRGSPAAASHSRTTSVARNVGRRTAFSVAQSSIFFDLVRSPAAAQRRTLVVQRWIL